MRQDGRRDEVGQDQPELERSQRNQPGYEAKVFSLMNASARLFDEKVSGKPIRQEYKTQP